MTHVRSQVSGRYAGWGVGETRDCETQARHPARNQIWGRRQCGTPPAQAAPAGDGAGGGVSCALDREPKSETQEPTAVGLGARALCLSTLEASVPPCLTALGARTRCETQEVLK